MKIAVKDEIVLQSILIWSFDPKLVDVVSWFMKKNHGAVITEGFRIQKHKNDLHGLNPVRAIDLRSWCYIDPEKIAQEVNEVWEYDYNRPNKKVAIFHGGNPHFHIQVHPHTRRRVIKQQKRYP